MLCLHLSEKATDKWSIITTVYIIYTHYIIVSIYKVTTFDNFLLLRIQTIIFIVNLRNKDVKDVL